MAPRWLLSSLTLLFLTCSVVAIENDFSFYPEGAQSCLYKAANQTGCNSGDVSKLNTCLCGNNNNFITNSARCIGDESPDDVDKTYDDMASACDISKTPISVEKKDWQAAAKEGESATTTTTTTTTTTANDATASATASATDKETAAITTTTSGGVTITVVPTNSSDDDADEDDGLSVPATIGIGVGAGAAGAAVIGVAAFLIFRRRRRKAEEESHPMLPHWQAGRNSSNSPNPTSAAIHPSAAFPPAEPKPAWGGVEESPNVSQAQWDAQSPYVGAYSPHGGTVVAELPPTPAIFEMDGTGTAAEMSGSALDHHQDDWTRKK